MFHREGEQLICTGAMAGGGGVVSQGEVKHYDGRTTFFVLLTCVLAASGGLMFGYDVGISGTDMHS